MKFLFFLATLTICTRSSYPFYIVTYFMKWVTTLWTYSMSYMQNKVSNLAFNFNMQICTENLFRIKSAFRFFIMSLLFTRFPTMLRFALFMNSVSLFP